MARIYLSSTYADLKDARASVYHALRRLGHDVVAMEDYVASDERPSEKCLADVRSCDLYLGIFAWRYGHVPAEGNGRSVTEMEFREAVRTKKPCLLFLLHEEAKWPRKFVDRNADAIDALRAEMSRDFTVSFFRNEDELAMLASTAVTNLLHSIASKTQVGRAQYLRSPWLGIEFWQSGKRCPLAKAGENAIRVELKPEPFEMCFPTAAPDSPARICASYTDEIFFQITPGASAESVPFFRTATGMADTPFGSSELWVREDAHIYLGWERLMPRPEGGGIYMFNAVYEIGEEKSGFPADKNVYLIVFIPRAGEDILLESNYECFVLSFEED